MSRFLDGCTLYFTYIFTKIFLFAFQDAYSLLFSGDENGNRFIQFHEVMLRTMCIFRKKTINRLFALHKSIEPANLLLKFISDNEPLFSELPKIYPNSIFVKHFPERLEQVWQWVKQCQLHVQYWKRSLHANWMLAQVSLLQGMV